MNDFQVSPHAAFKRGQQCSQWCPRTLNDDHECNAFLMMPLKWCFKFLILIFHEARRFKDLQGNMASVLIRYTEVAMTMAFKLTQKGSLISWVRNKEDVCCIYCISRLNVYVAACVLDAFKTKSFFHFPPHFLLIGSQSQSFLAVKPQFGLSLRGNPFDAVIISRLIKPNSTRPAYGALYRQ